VLLSQLVEDICGVKSGVVAQLTRDNRQGLGHGSDDELFLASDQPKV